MTAAAALFASTNLDALLVAALLLGGRPPARAAVAGLWLGFALVVGAAVVLGALARRAPAGVGDWLGLIPLLLGLRLCWRLRRSRPAVPGPPPAPAGLGGGLALAVANGSDNLAAYGALFAAVGLRATAVCAGAYVLAFAPWCALGGWAAQRPAAARFTSRFGPALLPAVLMGAGVRLLAPVVL